MRAIGILDEIFISREAVVADRTIQYFLIAWSDLIPSEVGRFPGKTDVLELKHCAIGFQTGNIRRERSCREFYFAFLAGFVRIGNDKPSVLLVCQVNTIDDHCMTAAGI